jgi:hypothetical protein
MTSLIPEPASEPSPSEDCVRLKKLGFVTGKRVNLYGEHLELVSDPFDDGECVAVQAISKDNPTVRTVELPVSLLSGWEDLFQHVAEVSAAELTSKVKMPRSERERKMRR